MKKCEICKKNPATVPDRNRMGRPINRVCEKCHAERLRRDMKKIVDIHNKKLAITTNL